MDQKKNDLDKANKDLEDAKAEDAKKQEELDYAKASLILFDDFRSGKMGRITLEWAPL